MKLYIYTLVDQSPEGCDKPFDVIAYEDTDFEKWRKDFGFWNDWEILSKDEVIDATFPEYRKQKTSQLSKELSTTPQSTGDKSPQICPACYGKVHIKGSGEAVCISDSQSCRWTGKLCT